MHKITSWKVTQPNVSPDNLTPEPATLASLCKEQKVPYGMIYLGVSGLRERDRKGAIKGVQMCFWHEDYKYTLYQMVLKESME